MQWSELVETADRIGTSSRNVFQEAVQKAVLTSLSRSGCFDHLVFQGGTALRLFYSNPRFSEDIDLVMREGERGYDLAGQVRNVKRFCHDTFPFLGSVDVRTQKSEPELQRYVVKTRSDDPDQRLRVHVELANVPSYENEPRVLDHPPLHPAVRVESPSEILADKVCALAFRRYVKGRDLWDVHFLSEQRSVRIDRDLVLRKAEDYGQGTNALAARLSAVEERVRDDGLTVLEDEMKRFLPAPLFRAFHPQFRTMLDSVVKLVATFDEQKGDPEN